MGVTGSRVRVLSEDNNPNGIGGDRCESGKNLICRGQDYGVILR